jgi:hypothetical protein
MLSGNPVILIQNLAEWLSGIVGSILLLISACVQSGSDSSFNNLLTKGELMTEEETAHSLLGSTSEGQSTLDWQLINHTLTYRIITVVPNTCYSAGEVLSKVELSPETGETLILVQANITYKPAICAQVMTEIAFEGNVITSGGTFIIRAEIFDEKTKETILLE